ncbi:MULTISPECIES: class I SAM-dependent methyltransferase [unclassified Nocardioides]|uniref:class I SAM-dependent methyltransferase n=1 Tax=unclassified Nocardioides TaxID=2615069 RepID=UPI003609BAAD
MTSTATLLERFGAAVYDPFLAKGERRGMARRRAALLGRVHGDVLEIGAGTGLNVEHYPSTATSVVLTEPVAAMAARLRRRTAARDGMSVVEAPAERLPFADASFDTVVSTMVLCTVADVDTALAEVARVLRPGGGLLFLEHVHAGDTRLGRRQTRWAGAWAAFAAGCRCDRDLLGALRTRFDVRDVETERWDGMPSLVRPLVVGSAEPATRRRPVGRHPAGDLVRPATAG